MSDDTAAYTVTMKAGTGYDAPWVVVRADNALELHARLDAVRPGFPVISEVAAELAAIYTAAKDLGATEVPNPPVAAPATVITAAPQQAWAAPAPAQAQQSWVVPPQTPSTTAPAPVAGGKTCIHGAMSFKSGAKNGKPWSGFFCPTPKGTQGQCDPVWVG